MSSPEQSDGGKDADPAPASLDTEVLIVGTGVSGIGIGIELLRQGQHSFLLLEEGSEIGGTWRDNCYPGVAVDIPSASYCFSFETDFPWSRKFAPGREIQTYLKHCVRKYGLTPHLRFGCRATQSQVNAAGDRWTTTLSNGCVLVSRYLVSATGLFHFPKRPNIPGIDSFAGRTLHTARWDPHFNGSNRRIAVIGTGASAVQLIPELADTAKHLAVFQRTPIWVSPRLDRVRSPDSRLNLRRFAAVRALERFLTEFSLELLTFAIVNYRRLPFVVRTVQRVVRWTMLWTIAKPEIAQQLIPSYGLGCKRPATSNRYLQAFNKPTVSLHCHPIESIDPTGLTTRDGKYHTADALILATGFLTTERGSSPSFKVLGTGGRELAQWWQDQRMHAYAGVSVQGFPNFFLSAGPYSGGFNWFSMLEAHAKHMVQCMVSARLQGATRVEVTPEAQEQYMRHMWQRSGATVFKNSVCHSARSYYLDSRGDASLPLPHTPGWRKRRIHREGTRAYYFGPR